MQHNTVTVCHYENIKSILWTDMTHNVMFYNETTETR